MQPRTASRADWHAEELQLEVPTVRKRMLGEDHPDTLSATDSLVITHRGQGRHAEAEKLQAEALKISKRVLEPDHLDKPEL